MCAVRNQLEYKAVVGRECYLGTMERGLIEVKRLNLNLGGRKARIPATGKMVKKYFLSIILHSSIWINYLFIIL